MTPAKQAAAEIDALYIADANSDDAGAWPDASAVEAIIQRALDAKERELTAAFADLIELNARTSLASQRPYVEWIERYAVHGIAGEHEDGQVEWCRAGQFDRTFDADGTPGEYPCTCGLDRLRDELRKQVGVNK